jgi:hypothetical protein
MLGQHPIVGSFLVLLGLILFAYYKEVARQIVEGSKLSRIWAVKDGEYILWRILNLVIGADWRLRTLKLIVMFNIEMTHYRLSADHSRLIA